MTTLATKKKRRRSERGNWLVVTMVGGEIDWCRWVQTWAGVQMSKRHAQEHVEAHARFRKVKGRVFVLDIERMIDFAVTEGSNEINELHRLFSLTDLESTE